MNPLSVILVTQRNVKSEPTHENRQIRTREKKVQYDVHSVLQNTHTQTIHSIFYCSLHHSTMKAMTNVSRTELINSEHTIDITEERRTHRISPMCRCRDVSSRKDLIFLMKLLLDDLEKTDPVLRANIAQVRDLVPVLIYSISFSIFSHASFISIPGRS
jgi:hypothetical protein